MQTSFVRVNSKSEIAEEKEEDADHENEVKNFEVDQEVLDKQNKIPPKPNTAHKLRESSFGKTDNFPEKNENDLLYE